MSQLYVKKSLPFEIYEINIIGANEEELGRVSSELGLSLSLREMSAIKEYFVSKRRNPTDVELQTIGQTWSEHCYHKTFKGYVITADGKVVDSILKTYIAKVVQELNPPWCISVFEDNAGIVDFDQGYGVAVKVETHNHPSAIEPFGGAATGVGGVIRDILGVWAEPIANIDVLCFGPLDLPYSQLPAGVKHPRYLLRGVVAGIGHYGNNMGIPTVCGAVYFDEGYVGNVVVYCGCIGVLPLNKYIKRVRPGDVAILAGGKTGRDGIHGVTFASVELDEESDVTSRSAVQIPNPVEEEKLRRAVIRIRDEGIGSAITDLGGGGLSSAAGETANKFGCGVDVELSKVPLKDPDMSPWEIWISESQERMLLVVPERNVGRALEIFEEEDVEASPIGRFTDDGILRVRFRGHVVAELDVSFLFSPPKVSRYAEWSPRAAAEPEAPPSDCEKMLLALLSSPNVASREAVIRTYDHEVRAATVLKPLHGPKGGPSDAAVLKPLPSSWKGIAVACGIKPSYGKIDAFWMAASCIDEAIRNTVAVGGRRWALLDNFTWGNPEKPDRMGSLLRAAEACYHFAKAYRAPFISGKDSLYNESPLGPVTPTLLVTAVGVLPDVRRAISIDLKRAGNLLYVVGVTYRELGGSEYYRLLGLNGGSVPKVNPDVAARAYERLVAAMDSGCVAACHDASDGGVGVALSEMCLSSEYGAKVFLSEVPRDPPASRDDVLLFSESNSRLIVEVRRERKEEFEGIMKGCPFSLVGEVLSEPRLIIHGVGGEVVVSLKNDELWRAWTSGLKLR